MVESGENPSVVGICPRVGSHRVFGESSRSEEVLNVILDRF